MGNQNSSSPSDSSPLESKTNKKRKNADPSSKHPTTTSKKSKTQKMKKTQTVSGFSLIDTVSSSESPFAFLTKRTTKTSLVDNSNLNTSASLTTAEEKITEEDTKHNNKSNINDFHLVVKKKYLDLGPGRFTAKKRKILPFLLDNVLGSCVSLTELYETLKSSRQFDNITKEEVETHMKDLSRHLNDIKGLSSTCWVTSGSETYYFDPRVFKINEDMGNETKETSEEVELLLPMKIAHYEIHHENSLYDKDKHVSQSSSAMCRDHVLVYKEKKDRDHECDCGNCFITGFHWECTLCSNFHLCYGELFRRAFEVADHWGELRDPMGAKLKSDDNEGYDSQDEDYDDDDEQEESNSNDDDDDGGDDISSDEEDDDEKEKKTPRDHAATKKPKMSSSSSHKRETKRTVEREIKEKEDESFHEMDSSDEERVEEEALKGDKWQAEDRRERFCTYQKHAKRMDEIEHEQRVLQFKEKQKRDREQRFLRRQRK